MTDDAAARMARSPPLRTAPKRRRPPLLRQTPADCAAGYGTCVRADAAAGPPPKSKLPPCSDGAAPPSACATCPSGYTSVSGPVWSRPECVPKTLPYAVTFAAAVGAACAPLAAPALLAAAQQALSAAASATLTDVVVSPRPARRALHGWRRARHARAGLCVRGLGGVWASGRALARLQARPGNVQSLTPSAHLSGPKHRAGPAASPCLSLSTPHEPRSSMHLPRLSLVVQRPPATTRPSPSPRSPHPLPGS